MQGRKLLKIAQPTLIALAVGAATVACAAAPKPAASNFAKSPGSDSHVSTGNPQMTSLLSAAGNDVVLLAAIPARPWAGLLEFMGEKELPPSLAPRVLWLNDSWSVLKMLLRIEEIGSTAKQPMPAGWDQKRPVLLALVNEVSGSEIERINAITFDSADVPMHVRVIVPAENATVLGAALQQALANAPNAESAGAGRYLLTNAQLAVAVIAAKDHVRLELLDFRYLHAEDGNKSQRLSQLDRTLAAPEARPVARAASATDYLVAQNSGIVVGFRPVALAQQLGLEDPKKVRAALENVDPKVKARILAEGLGEILQGQLFVRSGKAEIAEVALALNFDGGISGISLAQLTPTGQKQVTALIDRASTPLETNANALASVALTLLPGGDIKNIEPVLGTHFERMSAQRFVAAYKEAGLMASFALCAKPFGLLRKFLVDASMPGITGDLTKLPSHVSFELLDVSSDGEPAYRWRAHIPEHSATPWFNLLQMLAHANSGLEDKEVERRSVSDGAWLTWTHGLQAPDGAVPSSRRVDLPPGTFTSASIDLSAIARRWEAVDPGILRREKWLLQLLRRLRPVELSTRLEGNWVIGTLKPGLPGFHAPPSSPPPVEAERTEGHAALERAIALTSQLLETYAIQSDGERTFDRELGNLHSDLNRAKSDAATKADAIALERLLGRVQQMLRESAAP